MAEQQIEKGDQVSWQWSGSRPSGEVAEVAKEGELSIESNKGNTIKRNADPSDPAVHVARSGNDVVKRAHELDVEEKANGAHGANGTAGDAKESAHADEEKEDDEADDKAEPAKPDEAATNGDASAGDKRTLDEANGNEAASKADDKPAANGHAMDVDPKDGEDDKDDDEPAEEDDKADGPVPKKQKTNVNTTAKNGDDAPKRGGRGRAKNAEKKEPAKKKEPKAAATVDGQPRRSSRLTK